MKLLVLGLVPVLIFWIVEEKFGTFWGLVAAIVWAIGECLFEYIKSKKVEGLTLLSTGLVVLLGGLGLLLDNSILFKFQPVIMEGAFVIILLWGGRTGEPLLFKMAKKTRPEIFANKDPKLILSQLGIMQNLTRHLILILIIHSALLSYVAVKGTTGQWVFWKGVGFNVFVFVWALSEFFIMRQRSKKAPITDAEQRDL